MLLRVRLRNTESAFEQRVLPQLAAAGDEVQHCVVYADIDRLHVADENHDMHVGDEVIVTIAETTRTNLGANVSASRIS
jgi:GGDEF domain-containing protein